MHRLAGILVGILATAALGLIVLSTAPAGARPIANQPIAVCGWLKLQHGGLGVYRGYYTTRCRTAAEVTLTFWRTHRHGPGAVGQWRCSRRGHMVTCTGPDRQWVQSRWYATDVCQCGYIHLPPGWHTRSRQG